MNTQDEGEPLDERDKAAFTWAAWWAIKIMVGSSIAFCLFCYGLSILFRR